MQTAYLEAVVNRRHRVLGRRLHPFCLYDALFLSLAENPCWTGHRVPQLQDLQTAVLICSVPPERMLNADLAPRGICESIRRKIWFLSGRRRDFGDELQAWEDYVNDFNSPPELWDSETDGRTLRAPWILSLATYLEMNSNMTEREIMTAPIGLMQWKAQTIAERRGENVADIMTAEEIEIAKEQAASGEIPAEDESDG